MKRMLVLGGMVLVLVAALGMTGCVPGILESDGAEASERVGIETVSAVGNGKASAAPDTVEFGFGVNVTDATGKGAMAKAAAASDKIVKALLGSGIEQDKIQTQNLSLYPQYDRAGKKIVGYAVNVSVRASTEDLDSAPDVLEAATAAGATQVSGPGFTMSEDNAAHDRALEDAVDDARERADVMAKAAGRTLGDVVRITEGSVQSQPYYSGARFLKTADMAYAAAMPSLQPGELDAFATVTVEFVLR